MTKKEVMTPIEPGEAETVTSDVLAAWLGSKKAVLLIDCRSFGISDKKKLKGALLMRCSSIKIRRCKGNLPLNDIIPDETKRTKLSNGEYECVVIYDEKCITSNARLVYKTIAKSTTSTRVSILKDGVVGMEQSHPGLIDSDQTAEAMTANGEMSDMRKEFMPLEKVDEGKSTHTPEYDQGVPVNIDDDLYLGSAAHASQLELLERLGITALLNVSPNCKNHWPEKFEYQTIPVEDNSTADIKAHFNQAIAFINHIKAKNGKILVHCKAGVSRSATLCLAYLISNRKMNLDEAYNEIKQKRRVISPNFNFMGQLLSWQKEQLGIGPQSHSAATGQSEIKVGETFASMSI